MKRRAELLANRIEEGSAGLATFAEGLSDAEWGVPVSSTDRRTLGQVVNHVALVPYYLLNNPLNLSPHLRIVNR